MLLKPFQSNSQFTSCVSRCSIHIFSQIHARLEGIFTTLVKMRVPFTFRWSIL